MKRYFNIIVSGICLLLVAVSCDVMDTKPFTSFDDEAVWGTPETTEAFIIGTYSKSVDLLAPAGGGCRWMVKTPDGVECDQVYSTADGVVSELGLSNTSDYGFNKFAGLRACNLIIEKVNESSTLPDGKKKEFIAEARFLRGCIFFEQARKIGRFVPITKVLQPDDKEEFLTPITSSVAESYKYVMDDLDAAIAGLPESSPLERVNVYTAHLIRSRAALQAYAYTKDASYLDKVIESANAVINSGKYTLTDKYGDMFNQEAPRDPEIIMARYLLAQNTIVESIPEINDVSPFAGNADVLACTGSPLNDPANYFSCWSEDWPTQDLVDQYLQIDEKTGEAKNWWETSQYKENVIELDRSDMKEGCVGMAMKGTAPRNLPTAVDMITGRTDYELFTHYGQVKDDCTRDISDIMYENRDKRMDYVVVRDKIFWHGESIGTNLMGSVFQGLRGKAEGGWFTTCTGYYFKKGVYTNMRLNASMHTDYHFVIARLGEAYLNLAEAQLLKKNIPAAVEALNATRVKHGGLPPSTASTEEEAWADYIRERRCDMAEEHTSDTYFSFLRWGKYGGYANYGRQPGDVIKDLDRPVYKICISQDRRKYSIGQVTLNNAWNRNFTTRRYLFPIPQGQLDTRSIYGIKDTQNEGW